MEIISTSANIILGDSDFGPSARIDSIVSGYVADIRLWQNDVYVATHMDDPGLRILIAPSANWRAGIEADGYNIIGKLHDLVAAKEKSDEESDYPGWCEPSESDKEGA